MCAFSQEKNRYYTLSGLCTESNCAGMYSVHGRVIVNNMFEFQQIATIKKVQKIQKVKKKFKKKKKLKKVKKVKKKFKKKKVKKR